MHLSVFSESFLSDRLDDSGVTPTAGVAHRDGVLRGLAMLGVMSLLAGLVGISGAIHCADADAAPSARGRTFLAPVIWQGRPRDKVQIRAIATGRVSPLRQ